MFFVMNKSVSLLDQCFNVQLDSDHQLHQFHIDILLGSKNSDINCKYQEWGVPRYRLVF